LFSRGFFGLFSWPKILLGLFNIPVAGGQKILCWGKCLRKKLCDV
jgi:hypothetical protein